MAAPDRHTNKRHLIKYVLLFILQMGLLLLLKTVYPQYSVIEWIQMEFTGIDPLGNRYLFSIGILLLCSWLELYVLFQPVNGFFTRYNYLYGRISGKRKKKLAAFVSGHIVKESLCCMLIHICCGGILFLLEQSRKTAVMDMQSRIQNFLCFEILHFMTLLIWGSFMILLFYMRIGGRYLWMIICLILCIAPIIQNHIVTLPLIVLNPYLTWGEQWAWKFISFAVMLFIQYSLVSRCCFYPVGKNEK